jgi:hypothetical protein
VALGSEAGRNSQHGFAVAIGNEAGKTTQGDAAVAVGTFAGMTNQGRNSVAIGESSGVGDQGDFAVAIGASAGSGVQSHYAIAIGNGAGYTGQGEYAIAIGDNASSTGQASRSIAIGSGSECAAQYGIAIGDRASALGDYAIVIGGVEALSNSGKANSIVLNASGNPFVGATGSNFYVTPVAESPGVDAAPLYYDTTTSAITYRTSPSVQFSTLPIPQVIVSPSYTPLVGALAQIQYPLAQRTALITLTANVSNSSSTLPIYVSFGVQDNAVPGVTIAPSDTRALIMEVTSSACASATFALTLDPSVVYPIIITSYARCTSGEVYTLNSFQLVVQLS